MPIDIHFGPTPTPAVAVDPAAIKAFLDGMVALTQVIEKLLPNANFTVLNEIEALFSDPNIVNLLATLISMNAKQRAHAVAGFGASS